MQVEPFFDSDTFTLTYVVYDADSRDAVVIDSVLDFDCLEVKTSTRSVAKVAAFLRQHKLHLHYALETHAHADHLSAAQYLKRHFSAALGIGIGIVEVQKSFSQVFDLPPDFPTDGSQFDLLLRDGEELRAGTLRFEALATPGHTPSCTSYRIADAIFVGDSLFIEDYGTGRCDFPGGDADRLYQSVHERLYRLPPETRVFVGHDYLPGGRALRVQTSIAAARLHNIHLREETTREDFVSFRRARDATLTPPRLFYQSLQVNIGAGKLPAPRPCGQRYLHLPLNLKQPTGDDGACDG
jgi:glyoxylase-like metal-dependent hydrolase (beta-lactamase superfamily II)